MLYVRGLPASGTTTLYGDIGADRFFVASNANKELFGAGGGASDLNPLVKLSGTLGNFGGLVIDTSEQGNQGTVDGIYISADQATTDFTGEITVTAADGGQRSPVWAACRRYHLLGHGWAALAWSG